MKDRYEEPPTQWIFSSGALGSGLAILSRFPIVSTSYSRYTLAGRPLKIFHGDFYVGKGFASACIDHPDIGIIEVFNTHVSSSSVRIIMEAMASHILLSSCMQDMVMKLNMKVTDYQRHGNWHVDYVHQLLKAVKWLWYDKGLLYIGRSFIDPCFI